MEILSVLIGLCIVMIIILCLWISQLLDDTKDLEDRVIGLECSDMLSSSTLIDLMSRAEISTSRIELLGEYSGVEFVDEKSTSYIETKPAHLKKLKRGKK
jgi:hypothetical protein